jgi:hypothetical protein
MAGLAGSVPKATANSRFVGKPEVEPKRRSRKIKERLTRVPATLPRTKRLVRNNFRLARSAGRNDSPGDFVWLGQKKIDGGTRWA